MKQDLILSIYLLLALIGAMIGYGTYFTNRRDWAKSGLANVVTYNLLAAVLIFLFFNFYRKTDIGYRMLLVAHSSFLSATLSMVWMINYLSQDYLYQNKDLKLGGNIIVFSFGLYCICATTTGIVPELFNLFKDFFAKYNIEPIKYYALAEFFQFTILTIYAYSMGKTIARLDKNEDFRPKYYKFLNILYTVYIIFIIHTAMVTLDMISPIQYYAKIILYTMVPIMVAVTNYKIGLFLKGPKDFMNDVIDDMQSGLLIYDENYRVVFVNDTFTLMYYENRENLLDRDIRDIFPRIDIDFSKEIFSHRETLVFNSNIREDLPILLSIIPYIDNFKNFIGAALMIEDSRMIIKEKHEEEYIRNQLINEVEQLEIKIRDKEEKLNVQKLRLMSLEGDISRFESFDPLTNLYNQMSVEKEIEIYINNNAKSRLAVMLFDIDDFKIYNDTFGYDFGDSLLRIVGDRLRELLSLDIIISRTEGDEFLIVYKGFNEISDVEYLAERISELLKDLVVEQTKVELSISMGIALYPEDGTRTDILIANADLAVNNAKEDGKNHYKFYHKEYQERMERDFTLSQELNSSIEHKEMKIKYLPITIIEEDGFIVDSLELVAQWNRKDGVLNQCDFIDLAERSGFISEIDDLSLKILGDNIEKIPKVSFTVHLSEKNFYRDDLIEYLKDSLRYNENSFYRINLEISEATFMTDRERSEKLFKELKFLGFKLYISEFGVQYSALSHLRNLDFDAIRLDRSFVSDIRENTSKKDEALIRAIYSLGRTYGVKIIADDVKHDYQFNFLKDIGFRFFQGYHVKNPIDSAKLKKAE